MADRPIAVYNDIDPYCCAVLRQHIEAGDLPAGEVIEGDVRTVPADTWRAYSAWHLFAGIGGMPYGLRLGGWPDTWSILTAGFPCQPVSLAGKRLAEDDPRWLWPEVIRVVRVVRPRIILLENVPGLLVRGMGDVLRDLAACGYDAAWRVLAAADVGAPHLRERVWIVAYPQGVRRQVRGAPRGRAGRLASGCTPHLLADAHAIGQQTGGQLRARGRPSDLGRGGQTLADPVRHRLEGGDATGPAVRAAGGGGGGKVPEPGLGGGVDGLSRGLDGARWPAGRGVPPAPWEPSRTTSGTPFRRERLTALGNAVVPQVVAALVSWMAEQAGLAVRGDGR